MEGLLKSGVLVIYFLFISAGRLSYGTPCNDLLMAADGLLSSGSYSVTNGNGQSFQIFCQFYSGYGYVFISNNTDVDVNFSSLMDDTSQVVIRHKRVNGQQYTSTIEQLEKYASIPILVQFNVQIGDTQILNTQMTPYIYVRFIPETHTAVGNVEGWKVNGIERTFTNCDGNINSYFAFLFDHSQNGYTASGYEVNSLMLDWYYSASQVDTNEQLPEEYFTSLYEIHHGGCGGYSTSHSVPDIFGAAVGVKFAITCSPPTEVINGASSYTSTDVGSTVTYICDVGYAISHGDGTRTCGSDGRWTGEAPTCTVLELTNVALGKQAFQTDTYCCGSGEAGLAVDGGLSQHLPDGSCSRTETKANSYWEVDLGEVYGINHVTIYATIDSCCADHLRLVEVYTGVTQASYKLVAVYTPAIDSKQSIPIGQVTHARWVKITRSSEIDEQLSLCEVQIMGYKLNSMFFKSVAESTGTGHAIQTYPLLSEIHCCRTCFRTPGCVAVNLNLKTRICFLLDSNMHTTPVDPDVVFFAAIYRNT